MTSSPADAPPTVLFLGRDPAWRHAAEAAAAAGGWRLRCPASAQETVALLAQPAHLASCLFVDPAGADDWMPELVALTAGEAGSGVSLVLLGQSVAVAQRALVVSEPRADLIAAALGRPPAPVPPALSDAALRSGIAEGAVDVRVQPIVRLADRAPVGFELLARLNHPTRGTFAPGQFIPQAERAGLGQALTEAVATRAFAGLPASLLQSRGLFSALNMPLDVLLVGDALRTLERQRSDAGLRASDLLLELTESRPVQDLDELAAAVERWRFAGYRLAIDDVGPDILNHRALFRLPFDAVKFDMAVVRASAGSARALRYLSRTAEIARRWGLTIIAEGVADEETWQRMGELGVDQVQGFLVGRPLPPRAAPLWLRDWELGPMLFS